MPEEHVKMTFLLDVADVEYPWALNIFALSPREALDVKLRQRAIDRILRVFEKLFPSESRMLLENLLRVVTHTLIDNPGSSLGDIPRLLYDDAYRARLCKNLRNKKALEYWELEYNPMSPSSRTKM